ncbi:MAG TPA: hypothetical protein VI078_17520, partial [bacterium]
MGSAGGARIPRQFDVVHDHDVGQVFQELRGLVEEGAVVFVPLDHEVAPAADPVAALEVLGDPADEHIRIRAAVRQQPPGQRGRRGLSVRAGDDDGARGPEKMIAHGFGQRAVPDLPVEDFFELHVAARDRIADDDEVEVARNVRGVVSLERGDALLDEKVAHGRIDVLIRPAHVVALALQQRGQRGHRGAT